SLEQDITEAMKDKNNPDPTEVFGEPVIVAKNLSSRKDWGTSPAGFGIRTAAYLIDFFLSVLACLLIITPTVFLIGPHMVYEANPIFFFVEFFLVMGGLVSGIFIFFCYPIVLEGLFSTTLGKKLFGMIVVDASGIKISWKQAIIRNLPKTQAEFLFFDVLIGKYIQKANNQRALDQVAETFVVRIMS
ncbi:MAG: RDD family protein, partial [Candidatus Hodarchaeota archaeon]